MNPTRDIDTQIQVNLTGLIHVTRAVIPYMKIRRSGHIINMSSIAGWLAAPSYTIYAATKYGVRGFTTALRRELAPFDIEVSGIYPGPAHTEFGWGNRKNRRPKWLNLFFIPAENCLSPCFTACKASAPHALLFRGGSHGLPGVRTIFQELLTILFRNFTQTNLVDWSKNDHCSIGKTQRLSPGPLAWMPLP